MDAATWFMQLQPCLTSFSSYPVLDTAKSEESRVTHLFDCRFKSGFLEKDAFCPLKYKFDFKQKLQIHAYTSLKYHHHSLVSCFFSNDTQRR
jgi:hypothetical protein